MLGVEKNFLWIIIYKDKLKNSNYLKIKFVEVFIVVYIIYVIINKGNDN